MSLITCENVSFAYEGNIVLEDLNFSIEEGNYLCIVGENGAGKSTLVKGLLHLKKYSKGSITMFNLHSHQIGYLPQQTSNQKDFPASLYEVVLSGRMNSCSILPFYSRKDKQIASEMMQLLGIEKMKNKCYRELSGGQQQRALLARALCATKKLLLLDEPATGLDPIMTGEFYQLLERINQEKKITIIMVSHDIHSAVKFASHILHLGKSQFFYGTTTDYIKSDLGKNFLGGKQNE